MLPLPLELKAGAVLLAVVGLLAGYGFWTHKIRAEGVAQCQAEHAQAAAEQHAANEHRAGGASADYQAQAAAIHARQPENRYALHQALRAPLACSVAASQAVGDVLVPAAAVARLRAAAAPAGADSAATR